MKRILFLLILILLSVCSMAWATGRFVDGAWLDDRQFTNTFTFTNAITINQTTPGEEILHITCTNGAYGSCSCYSSTISTKIGSLKITVNGVTRWIRLYDDEK